MSEKEIPMTPDESIRWEVMPVTAPGSMIMSSDSPANTRRLLERVSSVLSEDSSTPIGKFVGGGATSSVYVHPAFPTVALKVMNKNNLKRHYPILQANVTLSEGLKRVDQKESDTLYKTPEYYGAYFPYKDARGKTVVAMSWEDGKSYDQLNATDRRKVPKHDRRLAVYHAGIQAAGGDVKDYCFDMCDSNELIRFTSALALGEKALTIVKLDIGDAIAQFDLSI